MNGNDGVKWVVDGHQVGFSIESVWIHINERNLCTHNFLNLSRLLSICTSLLHYCCAFERTGIGSGWIWLNVVRERK